MIIKINLVFSFLALTFSFLPLFLYWWKGLSPDKTYLFVAIFWMVNGIANIPEFFHWDWYHAVRNRLILGFNLIDTPLILLIFHFTFRRKIFPALLLSYIVFVAVIIAWKGFNFDANKIITSAGGILILAMNAWSVFRYSKNIRHTDKDNVMVFVSIGFIFYYLMFFEISVVYGYLRSTYSPIQYELFSPYGLFICYIAIFLSTLLVSYGFWKYALTLRRRQSENQPLIRKFS